MLGKWSFGSALMLVFAIIGLGCAGTNGGSASNAFAPSYTGALSPVPGRHYSAASPKQRLYISGFGCNCFNVYNADGKLLGSVNNGITNAAGIATDPTGNIYVANRVPNGTFSVFKQGAKQPFENLTGASGSNYIGQLPSSVCTAKDGTIYATWFGAGRPLSYVAVYKNGATSPTSILTGPTDVDQMIACALDQNGNLFVTYYLQYSQSAQYASVLEFPPSGSPLDLGFLWGNVGGIATDSNGNVLVAASPPKFGLDQAVLVIKPGKHKPLRVLREVDTGAAYFGVAFDANRTFLYVVNPGEFKYFKIDYSTGKVVWAKHTGWTYQNEPYYVGVTPLAD
jgi:hypothetical protein